MLGLACSGDAPVDDAAGELEAADESTATAGPDVTVVIDGLDRPTQISDGPDGLLLVAQLAGGENDATGEILAVDVAAGTRRIIASGLDKPTGVLWVDDAVWVMVRQGLLRFDWADASGPVGEPEVVLDGLPFNGRSEGTLTALGDGRFLYATTGRLSGDTAVAGSGTLWAYDPSDDSSTAVAVGLKNAYAHVPLSAGVIAITEIGDGGTPPPVEEINVIDVNDGAVPLDLGWPECPGDDDCPGIVRPLTILPVASTPTGLTAVGGDLYATLFVTGQLVRIDGSDWVAGDVPVEAVEVTTDLRGPHTVLARPDGSLWISEHLADRIISVRT